jgi:hypothetical protein
LPSEVRYGMTLDDALDLLDLWREEPPVQWMLQRRWGFARKTPEAPPGEVPAGAIPNIPFKP